MKQWNLSLKMITIQKGIHLILQQQHFMIYFCLFHFRIFDDNIEMQSCEPYGLHNVPPSTDTKETEQIYEQV